MKETEIFARFEISAQSLELAQLCKKGSKMYFVYELVDPRTNDPRYVGITVNPNQRLEEHTNRFDGSNTLKEAWIQELQKEHLEPDMNIIEIVKTREDALDREQYYIDHYTQKGIDLTNIVGMKTKGSGEDYYTEAEVREMLNIDRTVLAVFIANRLITHSRSGYYPKSEIDKLFADLKVFRKRQGTGALTTLKRVPVLRKSD